MRPEIWAVVVALAASGCVQGRRLDADHAVSCVSSTFDYAEATRGLDSTARVVVEKEDKEFFTIGVFSASGGERLVTFRVGRDRQIWKLDSATMDWKLTAICD